MAKLFIAEFPFAGSSDIDVPGAIQAMQVAAAPAIAEQTVAIGASSTQCTNKFLADTYLIRVHTDAICSIAIGVNPTATTATMRLPADHTEYFGVTPGHKIAVIANT